VSAAALLLPVSLLARVPSGIPPAVPPQGRIAQDLAGTWNWVSGQTLVIREDGTLDVYDANRNKINEARWTVLDGRRRQVRFTHRSGGWVDTLILSPDGLSLDGTNNVGASLHGTKRVSAPSPPEYRIGRDLAGTWNWVSGQTLVIREDGTLDVYDANRNKINEARWTVLDGRRRQVRFTHRSGGWVDTLILSADGLSLDGTNNVGASLHGTKRR
jgi:hypothetical protein